MEVKNNHAHVTTQRILNKYIEKTFLVDLWFGCDADYSKMDTSKNIDNKIKMFDFNFEILWNFLCRSQNVYCVPRGLQHICSYIVSRLVSNSKDRRHLL